MPQVAASQRTGLAVDGDMTRSPAAVNLNFKGVTSRAYCSTRNDHFNQSMTQAALPVNNLDERCWQGNRLPGLIQYVTGPSRNEVRCGEKGSRDLMAPTLPFENARPLNTSQMWGHGVGNGLAEATMPGPEAMQAHDAAMASLAAFRGHASAAQRSENGHRFHRNERETALVRQRRIEDQAVVLKGLRGAGLASVNPRMGTCGSLPDLRPLSGAEAMDAWRESVPFAIGGDESERRHRRLSGGPWA